MNSCHLKLRSVVLGEPRRSFLERTGYPDESRDGVSHAVRVFRRVRDTAEHVSPHVDFPVNERLLLEECALRVADGRGPGSAGEVLRLLRGDFGNLLATEAFAFMEGCIRVVPSLSSGRRIRHQPVPETFPQRLLAFSDVGSFLDGWEGWLSEAVRSGETDIEGWIGETEACMDGNVSQALFALEPFLSDKYYDALLTRFDTVRSRLSSLRKEIPERDAVRDMLLARHP